jgi:hypothetical protein
MKRILMIAALMLTVGTGARAQFYSVKTNALGWAAGTINAGVEVSAGKRWSVEVSGYWNPVRADRFSAKAWWVQPAVRYWLYEHFVGHFAAAHPAYGRYDIGNGERHYEGWFAGLGISYGYTWILTKRWNLTAEGGIGLYYARDRRRYYEIDDWSPECITYYRRIVLAPSKLELSFSYLF